MKNPFTLEEIREYIIKRPNIKVLSEDVYKYWENRNWLTNKKIIVSTIKPLLILTMELLYLKTEPIKQERIRKKI